MALGHYVPAQGGRTESKALNSLIKLSLAALRFPGTAHLVAGYALPLTETEHALLAGHSHSGAVRFTDEIQEAARAAALGAGWQLRQKPLTSAFSARFVMVDPRHSSSIGKMMSSTPHSHACVETGEPLANGPAGRCDACGVERMKHDQKLLFCGGCKQARYCNAACQRSAWASHRTACRATRAAREAAK